MRSKISFILIVILSFHVFAQEFDIKASYYGLLTYDKITGTGLESGDLTGDGDSKFYWDSALDLQVTLAARENIGLITVLRFDRMMMNTPSKSSFEQRWLGIYPQEQNIASVGNTGVGLARAYITFADLPISKATSIGLMEWKTGYGGWFNAYHSRLYAPCNIAYYHPYGIFSNFTLGNIGMGCAFGVENTDKVILGTTINLSDKFITDFFSDNSTSDLYSIWVNRFASSMPDYWHANMRFTNQLVYNGPYYLKGPFATVHLGTELNLPFTNGMNIYTLFAYHHYKDSNREQGKITGGDWITIYPEVKVPLFLNIVGGIKMDYFKFNKTDTFGFKKNTTTDFTLFAGAEYKLSPNSGISFLWEFVYPHTSAEDNISTPQNEHVNFHHSFTPSFNFNMGGSIELVSYFSYSMWDPSYDVQGTNIKENREMIIGSVIKGSF